MASTSSTCNRRCGRYPQTGESALNILIDDLPAAEQEFFRACSKYSWIDGKYFNIIIGQSNVTDKHITAQCMFCDSKIQGHVSVSSNFTNHLKVRIVVKAFINVFCLIKKYSILIKMLD